MYKNMCTKKTMQNNIYKENNAKQYIQRKQCKTMYINIGAIYVIKIQRWQREMDQKKQFSLLELLSGCNICIYLYFSVYIHISIIYSMYTKPILPHYLSYMQLMCVWVLLNSNWNRAISRLRALQYKVVQLLTARNKTIFQFKKKSYIII